MAKISKVELFLFFLILALSCFFIFNNFLTIPRVGWDEGMNLQFARSISEFGRWQIQTAPGEFSPSSHYYSTGWTMLLPIALIFKIFGASFWGARIVMAFYIIGFLIIAFLLARRWFGIRLALASVFLLACFNPLYNFGKPVLGEVPSLFWFVLGAYFFEKFSAGLDLKLENKSILPHAVLSGACFGLCAASKLTYIMLLTPAIVFLCAVFLLRKQISTKWFFCFLCTFFIVITPNLWFSFIRPLQTFSFKEIFYVYTNANVQTGMIPCIKNGLIMLLSKPSLIYTGVFIVLSVFVAALHWFRKRELPWVVWLALLYGFITLLYFFKSPGLTRYLLFAQMSLVFASPFLIFQVADFFGKFIKKENILKLMAWLAVSLLMVMHAGNIFMSGYASFSDASIRLGEYIERDLPANGIVGVVNITSIVFLVPKERLINYMTANSRYEPVGINPLAFPEKDLPEFIIYDKSNKKNEKDVLPFDDKLTNNYQQIAIFDSYAVMQKK